MLESFYSLAAHEWAGLAVGLLLLLIGFVTLKVSAEVFGKIIAGLLLLVGIAATVGSASHLWRVGQLEEVLPPPGQFVDLGGYRVHVLAEGPKGAPPVVWFGGGHSGGLAHYQHHQGLRGEHRSILIDRPGTGWSDSGPFPRTTRREADEMIAVLDAIGEEGPYIFVGHSFGGLLSAVIAMYYPERTEAVVLLDATPLDVILYGRDVEGLESFLATERWRGVRQLFGLYEANFPDTGSPSPGDPAYLDKLDPMATLLGTYIRAGHAFANASILEELSPSGLRDRAFDTHVFDGALGDTPLYLVAPKVDPTTRPYVESVAGTGPEADRFEAMLLAQRERYMGASSSATRVVAPDGTGHNFPYSHPQFVIDTVGDVAAQAAQSAGHSSVSGEDAAQALIDWPGPYGGVPPLSLATPENLAAAYALALDEYRGQVAEIAASSEPADFANTILALEQAPRSLRRVDALLAILAQTATSPELGRLAGELRAERAALLGEVAHNAALFARVSAVHEMRSRAGLDAQDQRLVEVTHDRLVHGGAALNADAQERLREIDSELASLRQQFAANANGDERALLVYADSEGELAGLDDTQIAAAAAAAEAAGGSGRWAFPMQRPVVWPVLTHARDRELRERVFRVWSTRGGNDGERDNKPVMRRILALRGEKAQLFGFENFAQWQTAARMIGTPEAAMELLMGAWDPVLARTQEQLAELQQLAEDELGGAPLKPWDRLYFEEQARKTRFNIDMRELQSYFEYNNMLAAMFWSAERLYGLTFSEVEGLPAVAPEIRVYEVRRGDALIGLLWSDLFSRPGKGPASWASQYRAAAAYPQRELPLVALHSAITPAADGEPVLLEWERANVIFHEFGHTLHTLMNTARYHSLGPLNLPWDFIEVPSLLHERWFLDEELLAKFALHHETGEPLPAALRERLVASRKAERPFSLNLPFLGGAIVDMEVHRRADGSELDPLAIQQEVIDRLGLPDAVELLLYLPHAFHTFSEQYAAGVYTYLWSDSIAADAEEAFRESAGGLYDADVAARWRAVLEGGNQRPPATAFADFRGRAPALRFLLEDYGL